MSDKREIEPPDCYARAQLLLAELELIRQEMGRARDERPAFTVKGAAPREVYFEALALFRKADRLSYELTGDPLDPPPHAPPVNAIKPVHVLGVLDAALRELRTVKARLGVGEESKEPARDAAKQPSDVLGACALANRQLNVLLERPFAPADVYGQVSLASSYAARLVALLGGTSASLPGFERRKRPGDVYARLLETLGRLKSVASASGLEALAADSTLGVDQVLPSDCYDLASLVLAEVAFLHSHMTDPNPPYPFEAGSGGRRLPAHVFQCAGLLAAQVGELERLVKAKPDWAR